MKVEIKWRSINDPPKESGYVLLAITHHDIQMVVYGHCLLRREGLPRFTEPFYSGYGVKMYYWAELPKFPIYQPRCRGERGLDGHEPEIPLVHQITGRVAD